MIFDRICKEFFKFEDQLVRSGMYNEKEAIELYVMLKKIELEERKVELEEKIAMVAGDDESVYCYDADEADETDEEGVFNKKLKKMVRVKKRKDE